jgi:galactose mutarotase-like enzyme
MAFRLEGHTLAMEATVSNPGQSGGQNAGLDDLPFSFGYHPAFAWPLPGGAEKAAHKLAFEHEEPQDIRRVSRETGLLLAKSEQTQVQGHELMLAESLFTRDAMIWAALTSRSLSYGADGGAWLDVAFPDTAMLGLWQVPGARYICIEPWQGHADPAGFAGDMREKPGMVTLAPGKSHSIRMDVTVRTA